MEHMDTRFALVDKNGVKRHPYMKRQLKTNRFGFALTAPGESDKNGGGTYVQDIETVIKKMVFEKNSVRAKTTQGEQEGSHGIAKRANLAYELDESLQYLVDGAEIKPLNYKKHRQLAENIDASDTLEEAAHYGTDETVMREIQTRRGQADFRKKLLKSFSSKCCISNCDVESVLEAAHITPHAEQADYDISNGLLLRADLHTLYDLNLLGIDEGGKVHITGALCSSEYFKYHNKKISTNITPNMKARLSSRFRKHQSKTGLATLKKH